jgi:hypothetical protein
MPTVMTRITPHDLERLEKRAENHGNTSAQEITDLLNMAETWERLGGEPNLEAYRAKFVRAPERKSRPK